MTELKNRYDFKFVFDVTRGNPNGDPDAGNLPRSDPESGKGWVSGECLKRKVRNYVEIIKNGIPPNRIYVSEGSILSDRHVEAHEALSDGSHTDELARIKSLKSNATKIAKEEFAKNWICKNFFDVRAFGAVMSVGEKKAGQVKGPIQFSISESVNPIFPVELTITRCAATNESEDKDNKTMGRKSIVPYGLYVMNGCVNARLAAQTGFNETDLELLWESLKNLFEFDKSASRPMMSARNLIVFKHENDSSNSEGWGLGNAHDWELSELVHINRAIDDRTPARSYNDYKVSIDREKLPSNVQVDDYLNPSL